VVWNSDGVVKWGSLFRIASRSDFPLSVVYIRSGPSTPDKATENDRGAHTMVAASAFDAAKVAARMKSMAMLRRARSVAEFAGFETQVC
jgi:hypothetical protein